MANKSRPLSLFRLIEDALTDLPDATKVRRIILLAWPVVEVEHSLKVRLEEELGIIERHVLEAIARFGPIHVESVAKLMGLDTVIVEKVEKTLARFPSILTRGSEGLSASPDTLKRLTAGCWSREVIQSYGFLVNGPSGALARKELSQIPAAHRLSLDFSDGKGMVRDSSGRELDQVFWIAPSRSDGRSDLVDIVEGSNSEQRIGVGVPEGTVAVESESGRILRERWLLTMGELLDDGTLTIRPASRPQFTLLVVPPTQGESFAELLRRGNRAGNKVLRQDESNTAEQEIPKIWHSYARCQAGDGKLVITLQRPDSVAFWPDEEGDSDSDEFGGERDSATRKVTAGLPTQLLIALGRPFLWHPFSFAVRQVHPGDHATAAVMLKLRGINALQKLAISDPTEPFDLPDWWREKQKTISAIWGDKFKATQVPLADLLALARRSPSSELVEFVTDIS